MARLIFKNSQILFVIDFPVEITIFQKKCMKFALHELIILVKCSNSIVNPYNNWLIECKFVDLLPSNLTSTNRSSYYSLIRLALQINAAFELSWSFAMFTKFVCVFMIYKTITHWRLRNVILSCQCLTDYLFSVLLASSIQL